MQVTTGQTTMPYKSERDFVNFGSSTTQATITKKLCVANGCQHDKVPATDVSLSATGFGESG